MEQIKCVLWSFIFSLFFALHVLWCIRGREEVQKVKREVKTGEIIDHFETATWLHQGCIELLFTCACSLSLDWTHRCFFAQGFIVWTQIFDKVDPNGYLLWRLQATVDFLEGLWENLLFLSASSIFKQKTLLFPQSCWVSFSLKHWEIFLSVSYVDGIVITGSLFGGVAVLLIAWMCNS